MKEETKARRATGELSDAQTNNRVRGEERGKATLQYGEQAIRESPDREAPTEGGHRGEDTSFKKHGQTKKETRLPSNHGLNAQCLAPSMLPQCVIGAARA